MWWFGVSSVVCMHSGGKPHFLHRSFTSNAPIFQVRWISQFTCKIGLSVAITIFMWQVEMIKLEQVRLGNELPNWAINSDLNSTSTADCLILEEEGDPLVLGSWWLRASSTHLYPAATLPPPAPGSGIPHLPPRWGLWAFSESESSETGSHYWLFHDFSLGENSMANSYSTQGSGNHQKQNPVHKGHILRSNFKLKELQET